MPDIPDPTGSSLGWMAAATAAMAALWKWANGQTKERIDELKQASDEQKKETGQLREELKKCESTHKEVDMRLARMEVKLEVTEKATAQHIETLRKTHMLADAAMEVSGSAIELLTELKEERAADDANS